MFQFNKRRTMNEEAVCSATTYKKCEFEVIAVAYQRFGELKVFVQSWINQTEANWKLHVMHDGESEEFIKIMEEFRTSHPEQISFQCTDIRFNDYGHSLREIGLKNATGDYVLLTNADNYYIPETVKFLNVEIDKSNGDTPDVLIFDMIHSHENAGKQKKPSYSYFQVFFQRKYIDMGAAIVSTELAQKAGFVDKSYAADASYFEAISKVKKQSGKKLSVVKVPRVLLVHN
jgi:glycosyltransferase involved in cell wall biosynthesis